jgi:hypothetical protein
MTALMAALVSGCTVTVTPNAAVVAPPPPPVVVAAPEFYVWDGVEYVGEYNGSYMYLNAGGVWVVCDPVIVERFHRWEGFHPDWRRTAIHNDRLGRRDAAVRHDAAREAAERKAAQQRSQKKKEKEEK